MNKRISLKAWQGARYYSLAEILLIVGRFVADFQWELRLDEVAPGPGAEALETLDTQQRITTMELLHLVTPDVQIIDGKFRGYDNSNHCRIQIAAIDSTSWDIETDMNQIQKTVLDYFEDMLQ